MPKTKKKIAKGTKFRRIYFYVCGNCGKHRSTLIYRYFQGKVCRICRAKKIDENQLSLLPEVTDEPSE